MGNPNYIFHKNETNKQTKYLTTEHTQILFSYVNMFEENR